MLRIKEDKMQDLEKLGFIKKTKYIRKENVAIEKDTRRLLIQAISLNQYGNFKTINAKNSSLIYISDTVYDLFLADMVERI